MRSRAAIQSHPLHPILVAFPIGLFVTSFAFDLIGLWRNIPSLWSASWYCIIAGLIMGVVAAIFGLIDFFSVVPKNSSGRSRGIKHAIFNVLVLVAFIANASHRGTPSAAPDNTALLLSACGVLLLCISGWLGGSLVYHNQIGVDRRYANAGQLKTVELHDWNHPVCRISDLAEGQMMLAVIQGARVTVGRCAEGLVAFRDHCTHKGGPLSDGALVGCTVQCPWHGSQFNIHSGNVVAGPAERPLLIYDVVTRGDDVFVYPRREDVRPEKVA